MMESNMTLREPGLGELADRRRNRRKLLTFGAIFAAGLPIGFFSALLEKGGEDGFMAGTLPPWFAVLAAAVFLLATVGGGLAWRTRMDELDRRDHLQTNSAAGATAVIGFPVWFLLWKGGLAAAPDAAWLFGAAMIAGAVTYLYLKLQQRV
jgi:hypothetical protein